MEVVFAKFNSLISAVSETYSKPSQWTRHLDLEYPQSKAHKTRQESKQQRESKTKNESTSILQAHAIKQRCRYNGPSHDVSILVRTSSKDNIKTNPIFKEIQT